MTIKEVNMNPGFYVFLSTIIRDNVEEHTYCNMIFKTYYERRFFDYYENYCISHIERLKQPVQDDIVKRLWTRYTIGDLEGI